MRLTLRLISFGLLLVFSLLACNLSGNAPDAAATLQAVYTAQAITLQALQTQAASTSTPTPKPIVLPTLAFPTLPPLNTPSSVTPQSTLPNTGTPIPLGYCDWAAFVKDVTVPDGTTFAPGSTFTKTWRLKNIGTCIWNRSYALVFLRGDAMKGSAATYLADNVAPGQSVDVSIKLSAPADPGEYRGYWSLRNDSGVLFGLGGSAKEPIYVDVEVVGSMTTVYDFAGNYCSADWRSEAGDLGCPGNEGGKKGYAIEVKKPILEDGTKYNGLGILTVPENIFDGYLRGFFPAFAIKRGDYFRAIISCEYLATGCNVIYRLDYQIGKQDIKTFWKFNEAYEGEYYEVEIDLSSLAGKKVKFILTVLANGSASADRPLWVAPRIDRLPNLITSTPSTPTITATNTRRPRNTRTPTPTATRTRRPRRTPTPTP